MPTGKYKRNPRTLQRLRPAVSVIGPSIAYIPLTKGLYAIVDSDDVDRVSKYNWSTSQKRDRAPYATRCIYVNGLQKVLGMHRFILALGFGDSSHIDHVNRNTLDNRKSNLRPCSPRDNHANQGTNRNNTSGLKGAYLDKRYGYWFASIRVDNRQIYLGRCKDADEAHRKYAEAAKRYKGEFARV